MPQYNHVLLALDGNPGPGAGGAPRGRAEERPVTIGAGVGAGAESPGGLLGRLATSRSGRDAGAVYLVIGAESATVVLVADGRHRSVKRPKRKNVKHLELGAIFPAVAERLAGGPPLTDEELRATIAAAAPSRMTDG